MSIHTHASSGMAMLLCLGGNGLRSEPSSLPSTPSPPPLQSMAMSASQVPGGAAQRAPMGGIDPPSPSLSPPTLPPTHLAMSVLPVPGGP